jgi:hypothetical protein
MRERPILSLAAHLNGQTWAMQLGKTGGGPLRVSGAKSLDRAGPVLALNHDIHTRARARQA